MTGTQILDFFELDLELEALARSLSQAGEREAARAIWAIAALRRLEERHPSLSAMRSLADQATEIEESCRHRLASPGYKSYLSNRPRQAA